MTSVLTKLALVTVVLSCTACVLDPAYDEPEPAPYGYYGYGPAVYPWGYGGRVNVEVGQGWGHGGYYGGRYR